MLQLLRRLGSSRNDSGSLSCPRCRGTRIRLMEQMGAMDHYRCHTWLTPLNGHNGRMCGQQFLHQTKTAEDIPADVLAKRPGLAYSTSESEGKKFLPRLSVAQMRKLFSVRSPKPQGA